MSHAKPFWSVFPWPLQLLIGLVTLVLALYLGSAIYSGIAVPSARATGPDRYDALNVCKEFVKRQLRSPSSANFGSLSDATMTSANGTTWLVRGWVDSQNGFGAQLRSDYSCTTQLTGDQWLPLNVTVTPR